LQLLRGPGGETRPGTVELPGQEDVAEPELSLGCRTRDPVRRGGGQVRQQVAVEGQLEVGPGAGFALPRPVCLLRAVSAITRLVVEERPDAPLPMVIDAVDPS